MAEIWTCSWCKKLNLPATDCLWCYGLRKQGEAACWEIIQAMRTATCRERKETP